MEMAKEDAVTDVLREKLQMYQKLIHPAKTGIKDEGLEQKSLTDTDSRRMKITVL